MPHHVFLPKAYKGVWLNDPIHPVNVAMAAAARAKEAKSVKVPAAKVDENTPPAGSKLTRRALRVVSNTKIDFVALVDALVKDRRSPELRRLFFEHVPKQAGAAFAEMGYSVNRLPPQELILRSCWDTYWKETVVAYHRDISLARSRAPVDPTVAVNASVVANSHATVNTTATSRSLIPAAPVASSDTSTLVVDIGLAEIKPDLQKPQRCELLIDFEEEGDQTGDSTSVADGDSSTQNSSFCNATTSEQQVEVGTDKPMSTLPRIEAAGHLLDMMDLVFEPDYSSPKVDLSSTVLPQKRYIRGDVLMARYRALGL